MQDTKNQGFAAALAVVFFIAATAVSPAVDAQLWNWFVAEPFGVLRLTYLHAIGLTLTVIVMLNLAAIFSPLAEIKNAVCEKPTWISRAQKNFATLLVHLIAIGVGWLIHFGV